MESPPRSVSPETKEMKPAMTEDEIALYDRQIRLWGFNAQEKIRSANVLLITMRALGNEVAKNLVLAGVGSLTIMDDGVVTRDDFGSQFLLAAAAAETAASVGQDPESLQASLVGQKRAEIAYKQLQQLNPRVNVVPVVNIDRNHLGSVDFALYDLVIATDLPPLLLDIVNVGTRLTKRPLYAASTYGLFGYIWADLIEHDFTIVRDLGNRRAQLGRETRTRSVLSVAVEGATDSGGGPGKEKAAGQTKERITKLEKYSSFHQGVSRCKLPSGIRKSPRRLRNVTQALACIRALWDFQVFLEPGDAAATGRLPDYNNPSDVHQFTELVTISQLSLGMAYNTPITAEFIRLFLQNACSPTPPSIHAPEIAPVATILGGELAQDVINTLGHTQQPIQNIVVFDGSTCQASTYALHPSGPLGHNQLMDPTHYKDEDTDDSLDE